MQKTVFSSRLHNYALFTSNIMSFKRTREDNHVLWSAFFYKSNKLISSKTDNDLKCDETVFRKHSYSI